MWICCVLSACSIAAGHGAPSPTPVAAGPVASNISVLRSMGLVATTRITARGPDGTALYVYRSVCRGSADGHCQAVDAFRPGRRTPVWHHQYLQVVSIRRTRGGFSVTADRYRPQDPLCCPSLPPSTETFLWRGGALHALTRPAHVRT